jgi:hypothetical protein
MRAHMLVRSNSGERCQMLWQSRPLLIATASCEIAQKSFSKFRQNHEGFDDARERGETPGSITIFRNQRS